MAENRLSKIDKRMPGSKAGRSILDDYWFERLVYAGEQGECNLYKLKSNSKTKILTKKMTFNKQQDYETTLLTVKKWQRIRHPNICELLDYRTEEKREFCSSFYCIEIFMEGYQSTLEDYIGAKQRDAVAASSESLITILIDIGDALGHLKSYEMSYACVNPRHIAIDTSKDGIVHCKLMCMAGITESVYEISRRSMITDIDSFVAPEVYDRSSQLFKNEISNKIDEYKIDAFCLGLSVLKTGTLEDIKLLYAKKKFDNSFLQELMNAFMEYYEDDGSLVCECMRLLMYVNPEERINAYQLTLRIRGPEEHPDDITDPEPKIEHGRLENSEVVFKLLHNPILRSIGDVNNRNYSNPSNNSRGRPEKSDTQNQSRVAAKLDPRMKETQSKVLLVPNSDNHANPSQCRRSSLNRHDQEHQARDTVSLRELSKGNNSEFTSNSPSPDRAEDIKNMHIDINPGRKKSILPRADTDGYMTKTNKIDRRGSKHASDHIKYLPSKEKLLEKENTVNRSKLPPLPLTKAINDNSKTYRALLPHDMNALTSALASNRSYDSNCRMPKGQKESIDQKRSSRGSFQRSNTGDNQQGSNAPVKKEAIKDLIKNLTEKTSSMRRSSNKNITVLNKSAIPPNQPQPEHNRSRSKNFFEESLYDRIMSKGLNFTKPKLSDSKGMHRRSKTAEDFILNRPVPTPLVPTLEQTLNKTSSKRQINLGTLTFASLDRPQLAKTPSSHQVDIGKARISDSLQLSGDHAGQNASVDTAVKQSRMPIGDLASVLANMKVGKAADCSRGGIKEVGVSRNQEIGQDGIIFKPIIMPSEEYYGGAKAKSVIPEIQFSRLNTDRGNIPRSKKVEVPIPESSKSPKINSTGKEKITDVPAGTISNGLNPRTSHLVREAIKEFNEQSAGIRSRSSSAGIKSNLHYDQKSKTLTNLQRVLSICKPEVLETERKQMPDSSLFKYHSLDQRSMTIQIPHYSSPVDKSGKTESSLNSYGQQLLSRGNPITNTFSSSNSVQVEGPVTATFNSARDIQGRGWSKQPKSCEGGHFNLTSMQNIVISTMPNSKVDRYDEGLEAFGNIPGTGFTFEDETLRLQEKSLKKPENIGNLEQIREATEFNIFKEIADFDSGKNHELMDMKETLPLNYQKKHGSSAVRLATLMDTRQNQLLRNKNSFPKFKKPALDLSQSQSPATGQVHTKNTSGYLGTSTPAESVSYIDTRSKGELKRNERTADQSYFIGGIRSGHLTRETSSDVFNGLYKIGSRGSNDYLTSRDMSIREVSNHPDWHTKDVSYLNPFDREGADTAGVKTPMTQTLGEKKDYSAEVKDFDQGTGSRQIFDTHENIIQSFDEKPEVSKFSSKRKSMIPIKEDTDKQMDFDRRCRSIKDLEGSILKRSAQLSPEKSKVEQSLAGRKNYMVEVDESVVLSEIKIPPIHIGYDSSNPPSSRSFQYVQARDEKDSPVVKYCSVGIQTEDDIKDFNTRESTARHNYLTGENQFKSLTGHTSYGSGPQRFMSQLEEVIEESKKTSTLMTSSIKDEEIVQKSPKDSDFTYKLVTPYYGQSKDNSSIDIGGIIF